MRKIGIPVTIRIDETILAATRKIAVSRSKPLRTLLREIIEEWFQENGQAQIDETILNAAARKISTRYGSQSHKDGKQ
jgi:AICAR transformylase/IMP cyclohydrolase PurH